MMELETRTLYRINKTRTGGITGVHSGQYAMPKVEQTAIPWCITHDAELVDNDVCWRGVWRPTAGGICDISTGGPDHKWWEDT